MIRCLSLLAVAAVSTLAHADPSKPVAGKDLVFAEENGIVAVEAEHFYKQSKSDVRGWYLTTSESTPDLQPDADEAHLEGASGGAYLEALPDTRATHDDKLIKGENFAPEAGAMAILHYKVHIDTPGRYHVWVRTHSTGTEDNGIHVGIDGEWPASGQRWQTVAKRKWHWDSKQRTQEKHSGVEGKLYLDIDSPGEHEIHFSMREDGFEFDKFLLVNNREYRPEGEGPQPKVKSGSLPSR